MPESSPFIPADAVEAVAPADGFISAEHVEESHPENFIPAEAVDSSLDEKTYLSKLTRNQLVEEAFQASTRGEQDLSKYKEAYAKRASEMSLLDDNRLDQGPKEGSVTSLLHSVGAAAKTMWEGTKTLVTEAGKATGIDIPRSDFFGNKGIYTLPKEEQEKAAENVIQGLKLAEFRGLDMIRTFTNRVANRWFEGDEELKREAFSSQFDADLFSKMAQEGFRQGASESSGAVSRPTDPEKVEAISATPVTPSMVLPAAVGFGSARGTVTTAARALEQGGTATLDELALKGAGKVLSKPVQAVAAATRATSKTLDSSPLLSAVAAAGVSATLGGSADTDILAALVGASQKHFGLANRVVGGAATKLENAAGTLAGTVPPGPVGKFAVAAYRLAAPEMRSAVAGQLANTPFLLGAGDEEDFKNVLAGGLVAHSAFRVVGATANGLDVTSNLWRQRSAAPETRLPVKDYNLDPKLDEAHRKVVDTLSNASNNYVQAVRDYFGKDRGELFTLSPDDYVAHLDSLVGKNVKSPDGSLHQLTQEYVDLAKQQAGVTLPLVGEDGVVKPRALVVVSPSIPGLAVGHEAGHVLEFLLSDEEKRFIYNETARLYGEEGIREYAEKYNALVNKAGVGQRLDATSRDAALSEIFAEHASAVLNSIPIAKFSDLPGKRDYSQAVYSMVGRALEKLGVKRPQLVGGDDTTTATGIEPSARLGTLIENYVQAHRLDQSIVGTEAPKEAGAAATTSAVPATPAAPIAPIANVRPVEPKAPVLGFKKGDPIGELRDEKGMLLGEDAQVAKVIPQEGAPNRYEVVYTDPDTGQRMTGDVSEEMLRSPQKANPGAPVPVVNGAVPPPHPITDKSAPGYQRPEDVVMSRPEEKAQEKNANTKASENVRVTTEQQNKFGEATPETLQQNTLHFDTAFSGKRHEIAPVEADYLSAESKTGPENQIVREAQRRAADAAEKAAKRDGKPNPLRKAYQKITVPYGWVRATDGSTGKTHMMGMSLDKVAQNVDLLRGWAETNPEAKTVVDVDYLTSPELVRDISTYTRNQANGYAGDGQKLQRPADTRPGSVTPENPDYTPTKLGAKAANTINLLMGMEQPGKSTVAHQWAERFAVLNGITPEKVKGVPDTNPLRAELRNKYGFDPRILNSAVEVLKANRFVTPVKPRPDLAFKAGDTAFMRAGFMPRTDTPEFQKWFKGSKIVDDKGSPLVVYKGMYPYDWRNPSNKEPISVIERSTEFPAFNAGEPGVKIAGFFGNRDVANRFATGGQGAVYPVYLSLKNPYVIDGSGQKAGNIQFGKSGAEFRDAIRAGRHDGIVIKDTVDEGTIYVALKPEQIKSAIGNRGTFDASNPDIRFMPRPPEDASIEHIKSAALRFPTGEIVAGENHGKALQRALDAGHEIGPEVEEGFLTSDKRFVSRDEGMLLAKNAGQLKDPEAKSRLDSEDLEAPKNQPSQEDKKLRNQKAAPRRKPLN